MKKRLPLFGTASIIIILILLPRLWAGRLLYADPLVRSRVQESLERIAREEGILLSGFDIHSLTGNTLVVHHRAHARGEDKQRCYAVDLVSLSQAPCDASS